MSSQVSYKPCIYVVISLNNMVKNIYLTRKVYTIFVNVGQCDPDKCLLIYAQIQFIINNLSYENKNRIHRSSFVIGCILI